MKALCIVAAGALVAGLVASLRAEEEKIDNKALIVGIWELTKVSEGGPRVGTTMEFTKDGKFKMKEKAEGKEIDVDGIYVVEGDKLTATVKSPVPSGKSTATIKKLTDKELVTKNEDGGRVLEFKRMK